MIKAVIKIILSLLIIYVVFLVLFYVSIRKDGNIEIRYDIEPITRRFPIEGIESVIWSSDSFGETTFGKNTYWLKGYIILSDENSATRDSSWTKYNDFTTDFIIDDLKLNGIKWYHSDDFDRKYGGEIMFYTEFYFAPEKNILYVYSETD